MTDAEVRVTSETGGQKGKKLAQVGALDPSAILEVARVAGFGADKYERYNFLKGYDWSLAFDAMQRHALAYWSGEDTDPESGLSHMAHVGWHALALIAFAQRGIGTDDRPLRPIEAGAIPSWMRHAPDKDVLDVAALIAEVQKGRMTMHAALLLLGFDYHTADQCSPSYR